MNNQRDSFVALHFNLEIFPRIEVWLQMCLAFCCYGFGHFSYKVNKELKSGAKTEKWSKTEKDIDT